MANGKMSKYTHQELNKDIPAPAGYYTPQKEVRLKYNGREVLYVLSDAVIESSCCGKGDFCAALVPGYVKGWRVGKSKDGNPISEVEPINDEPTRDAIRNIIKENESVCRTEFW
jgi:hypothetical protein